MVTARYGTWWDNLSHTDLVNLLNGLSVAGRVLAQIVKGGADADCGGVAAGEAASQLGTNMHHSLEV